jgi:hypothetical protein
MIKTLLRVVPPVALACAVIASPASAKKHNADDENACKPSVTAVGEGITSTRARTRAIEAWKTKVTSDIGAEYANPDSAKNTSMNCHKAAVAKHDCTLKARPCKSEGKGGKKSH